MVDGWAGVAAEILRLRPLILYHLKNFFFVKTEKDREEAMDPGTLEFNTGEPQIQLYFLLGLVYAAISPILLPFVLVFFALAYIVYRHQVKLKIWGTYSQFAIFLVAEWCILQPLITWCIYITIVVRTKTCSQ